MTLIDKLKVPEFESIIDESANCLKELCPANCLQPSGEIFPVERSITRQAFIRGASFLTKELEKRNRVIEKLIEQRNQGVNNEETFDPYVKQVGAWKIIQRLDEELLSIIEGV
jgi:hypothetical protein